VAAQDTHAYADPRPLRCGGYAGEFRDAMQIDQAPAAAYAQVTVAVETNRSSCAFESAHAVPEGWVGRRCMQLRILIVGDDGQDRLQAKLLDQRLHLLPALGADGGA